VDPINKKQLNANIFYIEDNLADVTFMKTYLDRRGYKNFTVLKDGSEAREYFRVAAMEEDIPLPDLVLLDLNLPKVQGKQILVEIKANPKLRMIPVVVFSSSQRPSDVSDCYQAYANSYISKPHDLDLFDSTMDSLLNYWLNTVTLITTSLE